MADFEARLRVTVRVPFSADDAAAAFVPELAELGNGRSSLADRPVHEARSAATERAREDAARQAETSVAESVAEAVSALGEVVEVVVEEVTER